MCSTWQSLLNRKKEIENKTRKSERNPISGDIYQSSRFNHHLRFNNLNTVKFHNWVSRIWRDRYEREGGGSTLMNEIVQTTVLYHFSWDWSTVHLWYQAFLEFRSSAHWPHMCGVWKGNFNNWFLSPLALCTGESAGSTPGEGINPPQSPSPYNTCIRKTYLMRA